MHDHWSLFKSYPFERTFSFSGKYTEKEKVEIMVFIREIYNSKEGKVLKLENHLEWKLNDCITIVGINKSSEQMIYYDSYQVLKLCEKF